MPQNPPPFSPTQISSLAGCKRDGTRFDGIALTDDLWSRINHGRPKSMQGYRRLINNLPQIARGMNVFDNAGYVYVVNGMQSHLYQNQIDINGNIANVSDRTPAAFVPDPNNLWQFDYLFDVTSSTVRVIAHAAPNLTDISNSTAQPVWYGDATANVALTTTGSSVSGGVVVLPPYLFTFGTSGTLNWSVPNTPNDFASSGSGTARVTSLKVVAGLPIRAGAGNAPAGLFWALDSVIMATFIGGTPVFNFSTFSNEASILSSQSVVEYDGIYYWLGVDRVMSFNGVVREVPNDMNLNYFYDNLNFAARQKCFAFKIPRWGEIWFCMPLFGATECNYAMILNLREIRPDGMPVWYDTKLPGSGRTCGHESQVFNWPLVAAVDPDVVTGNFRVWQHEYGQDSIDGTSVTAIEKYFTTQEYSNIAPSSGGGLNASLIGDIFEPDFLMSGAMTVQMIGRANARAPDVLGTAQAVIQSIDGTGVSTDNQLAFFPSGEKNQRLMRFKLDSNVLGGSYHAGKNIVHLGQGDGRMRT